MTCEHESIYVAQGGGCRVLHELNEGLFVDLSTSACEDQGLYSNGHCTQLACSQTLGMDFQTV